MPGCAELVGVLRDPLAFASPTVGVGSKYKHPFPYMRRVNGGSRYNVPFRIKPERGKVCENGGESSKSECADVFHECEARSYTAHNSSEFTP